MTRKRILLNSVAILLAATAGAIGFDRLYWGRPNDANGQASGVVPPVSAAPTSRAPEAAAIAQAPTVAPVPVARPKVQNVSDTMEVTGNAAAIAEVNLLARVVGYLEKIHFEDGALVRKDDLLLTIQQDQYKAQMQQAQAQLQLGQAQLTYASTEVVRYTALMKKGAASQVNVDQYVYQQQSARANILAAEAQIALAQLNLDYTEVKAPFDGQMGKHLVDPGNVVGGSSQQVLAVITQLDPIYVEANISAQQALQVRANLDQRRLSLAQIQKIPIEVSLGSDKPYAYRGTLQYVAPALDPSTGTLFLRGILRNPDRTFLPGAFVRIRLPMEKSQQNALLVPNSALQEDQGGRYVLALDNDNVTQKRYVQIGPQAGALRVITSGLSPDDRIVIGELWRSSPGTRVVPQLKIIDG